MKPDKDTISLIKAIIQKARELRDEGYSKEDLLKCAEEVNLQILQSGEKEAVFSIKGIKQIIDEVFNEVSGESATITMKV